MSSRFYIKGSVFGSCIGSGTSNFNFALAYLLVIAVGNFIIYIYTTQTVTQGSTVQKPADPVKAGYTFTGWYAPGAAAAFDFNTFR